MQIKKLFIVLSVIAAVSLISLSAQCLAQNEVPTIDLEIYDGPDYSESDDMCYYRLEAIITGSPEPEVTFDEDANVSLIGTNRVEVGVDVGDSYDLTATAENIAGTVSATVTLEGDCGEEEEGAGEEEETEEEGTEEEAEEEEAEEEVAEEEAEEELTEEEEEPEEEEEEPEEEEEEPVEEETEEEEPVIVPVDLVGHVSGSIVHETEIINDFIVLGDDDENKKINGILSFDISGLGGETILSAGIGIDTIWNTPGDIEEIGPLAIEVCETIHEDRLVLQDFTGRSISLLAAFETTGGLYEINYSGDDLRDAIQNAIDEGKDLFQIRLAIVGSASMDGSDDKIQFDFSNVEMDVEY